MNSRPTDRTPRNALLAAVLLAASASALAGEVNLTAAPANAALPDGEIVPMWGYSCNAAQPDQTGNVASCRALKPAAGTGWSPVVITVGAGPLTINLTNNLPTPSGGTGIPTSLVIVGQLGGGLGTDPASRSTASPEHPHQGTTWPGTKADPDPSACGGDSGTFCPPAQGARVQSFGTEVANGGTTALTWANLRPGTYLIETGTHPSIQGAMGLYGVLVVTAGDNLAYTGVNFDADVPLLLSEIDPVQNRAVAAAVATPGFSETKVWSGQAGKCGDVLPSPTASSEANTCYPPAVNYSPRYYLVNGVSFDRSTPATSRFTYTPVPANGKVLVRFVNAGLRMHTPSIVGALTGAGTAGFTLVAEDGNPLPGSARVQSEVLLPAGKTYDVMLNAPASGDPLPVFDRELSLSTNNQRDGGMQAYINSTAGSDPVASAAAANPDTYYKIAGNTLTVGDVGKGVLANDVGVYGAHVVGTTPAGLTLNPNGTFTYTGAVGESFTYCGNGATSGPACATVSLSACAAGCLGNAPTAVNDSYSSKTAQSLKIAPPGILANDTDPSGLPLEVDVLSVTPDAGLTVSASADGSFVASAAAGSTHTFTYLVKNSQHTPSAAATVSITFPQSNNLVFVVKDAKDGSELTDYRWIIEEDRTVYINPDDETKPLCTGSSPPLSPPACSDVPVRNLAVNFHSSHMPVVATGCTGPLSCEGRVDAGLHGQTVLDPSTGEHVDAVCDIGNGVCRGGAGKTPVLPSTAALDPGKRYYISILPGDAANDTDSDKAHSMGGASISASQVASGSTGTPATITVAVQPLPFPSAQISVFVFEDDYPLNGEADTGGGVDVLAPNEPGLGGFSIVLLDQTGQFGDPAGQLTYDEFGQPVSNSLANTIDPATGLNACPISPKSSDQLVGMIVTCPNYEANADGSLSTVLSPLGGHALIKNMYPGLYEVHTTPGADRISAGEEWLQTNTLDGTKDIEAFVKPDEPSYFQEFGPGGYHVAVGFANPAIINARKASVCQGQTCSSSIHGRVTGLRMSRTPDQRVYSSGSYDTYSFAQCYVSLGAPDGADFAFTKCDAEGNFSFDGLPQGDYKVTVFDQWNDLLVDGLSTPIKVNGTSIGTEANPIEIAVTQWRTNLYGRIFLDTGNCSDENGPGVAGDGVSQSCEPGLPLVPYNIRYRDGSYMGFNNTDLAGNAGFNEVFPFLNWLVVDTDSARFKLTGAHVVYDAGGAADGTTGGGDSTIGAKMANTKEKYPLPAELRVPGARYCASADCPLNDSAGGSTGRVDPGWVPSEGWQGLLGNNSFVEFAMRDFAPNENGGIRGHVIYTSTRPFDDPALLLQLSWEPGVANVKVNLYQEGTAADGTQTLKLVDTTTTSSWDDWAQGLRRNPDGSVMMGSDGRAISNMSCPGQSDTSPFYYTMKDTPLALTPDTALSSNGRYKCYDGWSMLDQVQPVPYNGMYKFPSAVAKASGTVGAPGTLPLDGEATSLQFDPSTFKTNCTVCTTGPDGTPMLPAGKYVVEVVVPDGYELVKEEDKNILLGDVYDAPVEAQFAGFGAIFIMPDQAQVNSYYNKNNELQSTANNNASPRHEGDTGSVETFWPCVGAERIVPDFNSLFPGAEQQAPFAGATRRLCDRKEVTLTTQMTALAKFYVFTSAHVAGHYTGTITDDFASEFDPFSPQFGEKFAVPNVPVAIKDFTGKEITRVYADQWGLFNGMTYSTWTVNPPSPSGYIPQMMIACMNDPGPIPGPNDTMIQDPAYNPAYSNFCYEIPFMPGETAYLDTPVIPTMAFADGYNLPDCDYPDVTPAIKSVLNTNSESYPGNNPPPGSLAAGTGPWLSSVGTNHRLTITALGDKKVLNHAYSGPQATAAPYNQKFITRHYDFRGGTGTVALVGSDGVSRPLTNVSWSDSAISGDVTNFPASASTCPVAQRNLSNAIPSARCAQLVITNANGKKSIDTVTITIGGKLPTVVTPTSPSSGLFGRLEASPLQSAIDNATPGDLIIVEPGNYRENLLMWKPLRLQGVGAYSVVINADAHPAGKMDAWRRQLNCVFGLDAQGRPTTQAYGDCPANMLGRVDRMPLEGVIGWDTTANGNLAQQIQEPTLMGAYEGAGITVLGRGIRLPNGTNQNARFGVGNESAYPDGFAYLSNGNNDCRSTNSAVTDYGTSNFLCNPSRIDGVSVINSSQGGGAIFAHGWNHLLEVSNNRVYANHGTLTGGITIGTGEFPDPYIVGADVPLPNNLPANGLVNGEQAGYGFSRNTRVHNNAVTSNASIGDALYSGTNSGGGGVTFCTGADGYRFNDNWVCGNLSSGDGGGVVHSGFTNDGVIANNRILFNQSQSPTIPVNGGGLAILGASPDPTFTSGPNAGQECGSVNDLDCPPGLAEGTGRNLLIDGNLIVGNSSESGTGGGLRLQLVNGQDVIALPTTPTRWNDVRITNNIITNNVAGWDGGGISMQDALRVSILNNTVMSNDSTASAGVLFNTLGAPMAAVPPPGCTPQQDPTLPQDPSCNNPVPTSTKQTAGLVTMRNTPNLDAAIADLPGVNHNVRCPNGNSSGPGANNAVLNGDCKRYSYPLLRNNVFWQNRAFNIEVAPLLSNDPEDLANQQKVVTLVPSLNQLSTGFCAATGTSNNAPGSAGPAYYWEIGVRGDSSPTPGSSAAGNTGLKLEPRNSILTNSAQYPAAFNNLGADPAVLKQYCNGTRLPPENGGHGYNAPAGRSETTGLYPVFALNQITPAATVDEGNNWINLGFGPLSIINPVDGQTPLGNYAIGGGSPAVNAGSSTGAPNTDYFGTSRPQGAAWDIGAVEYVTPPIDLAVTKTDGRTNVQRGNTLTYTIVVSNNGPSAASGATLTDNLPGALRFSVTSWSCSASAGSTCTATGTGNSTRGGTVNLANGGTATYTLVGTVGTLAPLGALANSVQISGGADPNPANNTATDTDTVVPAVAFTSATAPGSLSDATLDFGNRSGLVTSTVTITANSAVTFTSALVGTVQAGIFTKGLDTCSGNSIAAEGTCTIVVNFNAPPANNPQRLGSLSVNYTGASGSPIAVILTGR